MIDPCSTCDSHWTVERRLSCRDMKEFCKEYKRRKEQNENIDSNTDDCNAGGLRDNETS